MSAQAFLSTISSRRSIYSLGKKLPLAQAELSKLVKEVVKQSPSSFNSQTSRVVILYDQAHDDYWSHTVKEALRAVAPADAFEKGAERLKGFQAAAGTVLFFESETAIRQMQEKISLYADRFPQWSTHSSGMAQINVWTAIEAAGLGGNLQHYGNLTNDALIEKYKLPKDWKLHGELVFGEVLAPAGEKTYMSDEERFREFSS